MVPSVVDSRQAHHNSLYKKEGDTTTLEKVVDSSVNCLKSSVGVCGRLISNQSCLCTPMLSSCPDAVRTNTTASCDTMVVVAMSSFLIQKTWWFAPDTKSVIVWCLIFSTLTGRGTPALAPF